MSKEAAKISRRDILGTIAKAGVGLAIVKVSPSASASPGESTAASNSNQRQQDSISIRTKAAQSGAMPPSGFQAVTDNGLLRAQEFSKILRRATPPKSGPGNPPPRAFDPALPDQTAFTAYKSVLDAAYARTFSGNGLSAPPDTAAIEGLEQYIGGDVKFRFTNPLGGLSFDLEGTDPASVAIMPPPDFTSAETAAEMAELYWMALLRDTSFKYLDNNADGSATNPNRDITETVDDLNKFSWFRDHSPVTRQRLFRARLRPNTYANQNGALGFEGADVGPFLSQFLIRGSRDNTFSGPDSGIVNFGALRLDLRQRTVSPGVDYLTQLGDGTEEPQQFLAVQNGSRTNIGKDQFDSTLYFIRTLRDGANYVHFDEIYQEYLIAASNLLVSIPRVGNNVINPTRVRQQSKQQASTKTPTATTSDTAPGDPNELEPYTSESGGLLGSFLNYGNPYRFNVAQAGFATFGVTQTLALVAEVSDRAHKAGWYQKWGIRRIRPEEYAARVDYSVNSANSGAINAPTNPYNLHPDILNADGTDGQSNILNLVANQNGGSSYLLPIAFPEGCPTHPAYPSGHATVAGASVTVLKALFDETALLTNGSFPDGSTEPPPYVVGDDGTSLTPFSQSDLGLTIGGELNKLVSNILYFRGFAGMHWRSDSVEGALVGERVAIELLLEQTIPAASGTTFYRERWTNNSGGDQSGTAQSPFFRLTLFSGQAIDIQDGNIYLVNRTSDSQSQWTRTSQGYSSYSSFQAGVYNTPTN